MNTPEAALAFVGVVFVSTYEDCCHLFLSDDVNFLSVVLIFIFCLAS